MSTPKPIRRFTSAIVLALTENQPDFSRLRLFLPGDINNLIAGAYSYTKTVVLNVNRIADTSLV
jgi:hypothetical protein